MAINMLDDRYQGDHVRQMRASFVNNGLGGMCNAAEKMKAAMVEFNAATMTPEEYAAAIERLHTATSEFRLSMSNIIGKQDVPGMARKLLYKTQTAREYATRVVWEEAARVAEEERQRVAAIAARERAELEAEQERALAIKRAEREREEQERRDVEDAERIRRLLKLPPAPAP